MSEKKKKKNELEKCKENIDSKSWKQKSLPIWEETTSVHWTLLLHRVLSAQWVLEKFTKAEY